MTFKLDQKDQVISALKEREVVVSFTKVNGEKRVMTCTLNESVLPPAPEKKEGARVKKENPDVCSVYDVNAKGWRSFRWENVTEVK
jgi:hypothetical protein